MTPEAIQRVSSLRREFYTLFTAAMHVPVTVSSGFHNSSTSIASWVDEGDRLNYVSVYAYTAPDALIVERPFILRIAINRGVGSVTAPRRGRQAQGLNQHWHFELTVLPEEILEFLPWIVSLITAKAKGGSHPVKEPPYPVSLNVAQILLSTQAWSHRAEQEARGQQPMAL